MVEKIEGIQTRQQAATSIGGNMGARKSIAERQKFRYLLGQDACPNKMFENVMPFLQNDQDGCASNGKLTAVNWAT